MTGTIRVVPQDDRWRLKYDGQSVAFATRTAALEAAAVAAERSGANEVWITVDPSPANPKQN